MVFSVEHSVFSTEDEKMHVSNVVTRQENLSCGWSRNNQEEKNDHSGIHGNWFGTLIYTPMVKLLTTGPKFLSH